MADGPVLRSKPLGGADWQPQSETGTGNWGDPLQIFRRLTPCQKLESWGYQMAYISRFCFRSARYNTGVWQTERQTDGRTCRWRKDRAMYSVARVIKRYSCNNEYTCPQNLCKPYQYKFIHHKPHLCKPRINLSTTLSALHLVMM